MQHNYFRGLNSLRFVAAFFVIISHASIDSFYHWDKERFAFLNRGGDAVEFFFTLSGFLISYLLMVELLATKSISIKQFYLRRIFRIWPLYFLITAIGFSLFTFLYPILFKQAYFTFPVFQGILCFILLIPNYLTSNYATGLLNPLWSIGVEEQFYLFWAPLFKTCKKVLLPMLLFYVVASTVWYFFLYYQLIDLPEHLTRFFLTQKFYAMAIGSLFAYVSFHHREWYARSFLSSRLCQLLVMVVLLVHYLFNFQFSHQLYFHFLLTFLYGLFILNVAVIQNKLLDIEKKPFVYLGVISYGLYMYHLLVDYVLRFLFVKIASWYPNFYILIPLYYVLLLSLTILLSAVSFKYFEGYFLRLKNKFTNQPMLMNNEDN